MTIEEAIKHCEEVAAGETEQGKCPECAAEHKQLAGWLRDLVALRAQKTKLDRSRWEGCDLCLDFRTQKPIEDIRGDIVLRFGAYANYLSYGKIYDYRTKKVLGKFKFCPFCGRPITEEARAELERRIST